MLIELFGQAPYVWTKEELIKNINALPRVQAERYSYLLHEWAQLTGNKLTEEDFKAAHGLPAQV